MTITEMVNLPQKIKKSDEKWIRKYIDENFNSGGNVDVVLDFNERTLKLYNNELLTHPKFISLLQKFKFYVQPSLL